ncbi:GspE/PulE family protein [Candidatus Parcubacteria bacterium]|nr:GspE/PulE family protein [Candidatus Parcubacteria bacterium]
MSQDARRDEERATQRRAQVLGLTFVDTSNSDKPLYKDILRIDELRQLRVIPLYADAHNINFGITNNTSQQTMKSLRSRFLDQRVSFNLISETGFRDYIRLYDPPKQVIYQDIKFSGENNDLFTQVTQTLEQVLADDILAYLVKQTYELKGSDIHLECQKNNVRIRMRVDGVLHPIAVLSYEKYSQLLSSIAIAANVSKNTNDAQTGHINKTYKMATGEQVTTNLRVETVPTVYGQDVVMRLFNLNMELLNLDKLGLSESERAAVDDVIRHPTGLVLIVGPTGSGKTTTLYSLINTLNSPERKIITLEDPVEYFLSGIVQIPVAGDENKLGFAEKLRAVLRLDPDVVMIGEIRDQDTARTGLQAALTGHLVLSTFHAGSAAAALTRMLDAIGINPLFSSAMHLVMAQRLVRRLDDTTKQPYQPDEALKTQLKSVLDTMPPGVERPNLDNVTLYKAGASTDNPFGYKGQMALREQLLMTPGVQEILRLPPNQVTTDILEKKAIEDGMVTMLQDGILKVLRGETTLEEVYRVVG